MTSYVLDTHSCLFALGAPRKLGRSAATALRQLDRGKATAWIPAPVVAEIVMLRQLGRTEIGLPQLEAAIADAPALRFLSLDLSQLHEFAALASIRDPFDRMIVSAARVTRSKLITKDGLLAESGLIETVWD